jgi:hypothetical protein
MFATHVAIVELLCAIPSSGICGSKGVDVGGVFMLEVYIMVVVDIEWIPSTIVHWVPLPFKHTLEKN